MMDTPEEAKADFAALLRGEITYEDYLRNRADFPDIAKREVDQKIMRKMANDLYSQYTGGGFTAPTIETLDLALQREVDPVEYRIDHMMVVGHNTNIAASYKVGKTTMLANRTRSLVDGVPFLDSFDVKPVDGRVVIFNYEVSEGQFIDWLRRIDIKNTEKVSAVNLRGKGFFLQDDDACEWAIKTLRGLECEVWEIDPLSAAIRGNTKDEETASDFISRVERVKAEAGVKDLVLTTHTGHLSGHDNDGRAANERTAGSARFMGWPDSLWTYTKDRDGHRYLSVFGRDVECEEFQVVMDKESLRLTDAGQGTSRIAGKDRRLWVKLVRTVAEAGDQGVTPTDLKTLSSNSSDVSRLREQGVEMGVLAEEERANGKKGRNPTYVTLTPLGRTVLKSIGE